MVRRQQNETDVLRDFGGRFLSTANIHPCPLAASVCALCLQAKVFPTRVPPAAPRLCAGTDRAGTITTSYLVSTRARHGLLQVPAHKRLWWVRAKSNPGCSKSRRHPLAPTQASG